MVRLFYNGKFVHEIRRVNILDLEDVGKITTFEHGRLDITYVDNKTTEFTEGDIHRLKSLGVLVDPQEAMQAVKEQKSLFSE